MFQAGYGMTEVARVFFSTPNDTLEQTISTIGCVVEHCEVRSILSSKKIWEQLYSFKTFDEITNYSKTYPHWKPEGTKLVI
jgi:hypothetical protein